MTSTYHIGLFLLRFTFSAMMLSHGIPKLLNLIQGVLMKSDPIGIGVLASTILVVIAEAICPMLIIIGYKTRLASIPTIITMGIAAFIVHGAKGLAYEQKELALLFLFAFVAIALLGPGKHSVDRK